MERSFIEDVTYLTIDVPEIMFASTPDASFH